VRHMVDRRRHGLLLVRTLPFHAAPIATAAPAPAPPAPASLTAGILGFAGSMRGVGGVRLLGRVLTGVFCLVGSRCRRSVSYGCGCKPVRGAPFAAATTTSASPAPSATAFAGLAAGLLALRLERRHLAGVFAFVHGVLGLGILKACVRR